MEVFTAAIEQILKVLTRTCSDTTAGLPVQDVGSCRGGNLRILDHQSYYNVHPSEVLYYTELVVYLVRYVQVPARCKFHLLVLARLWSNNC